MRALINVASGTICLVAVLFGMSTILNGKIVADSVFIATKDDMMASLGLLSIALFALIYLLFALRAANRRVHTISGEL